MLEPTTTIQDFFQCMINAEEIPTTSEQENKFVAVRSPTAGSWVGYLVKIEQNIAFLQQARRVWRHDLAGLASFGKSDFDDKTSAIVE